MRHLIVIPVLALGLAGCQTPEQSLASAETICQQSGFRPGTKSFNNCVGSTYRENRAESQATSNAVVAGATAGLVGGAVVAASTPGYYYGPGYYGPGYYGPRYYGGPYYGGYYGPRVYYGGPYYGRRW
jgi:hypothetical protein